MNKFVPEAAVIPPGIETVDFKLRMLTINDVVKDYDAVMSSVEHLAGVFGPDETWPAGLTLEEDLVDLGWHQKEFELKVRAGIMSAIYQKTLVLSALSKQKYGVLSIATLCWQKIAHKTRKQKP